MSVEINLSTFPISKFPSSSAVNLNGATRRRIGRNRKNVQVILKEWRKNGGAGKTDISRSL